MKKLMILGAIAAATVGYGAEASYLAQVYDATLTVKTGVCKEGKATAATVKYYESVYGKDNSPLEAKEEAGFRKQATIKIAGVFWGCECETIADPRWRRYRPVNGLGRNLGGYAFWNQTSDTYYVIPNTVFGWACLNRIGNDFKTVEGTWVLANNVDPQALYLMGAGFGKASVAANTCRSIISTISGSFAGFRMPGTDDLVGSCPYCGIDGCSVEPFCDRCGGWIENLDLTAAYGTWSIKFNSSASNKLKKNMSITKSYKFKKAGDLAAVLARMEDWCYKMDHDGNDAGTDHGEPLERKDLQAAFTYAINPTYRVVDGVVVDASGDEVETDDEAYLADLGYSKYTVDEGDSDVAPIIDVADLIDMIVEGGEEEEDAS